VMLLYVFVFFFQAEDGIRDFHVTGVQTCALPISTYAVKADTQLFSMAPHMHLRGSWMRYEALYPNGKRETLLSVPHYDFNWQTRSEERRVGKECRTRRGPSHDKKKERRECLSCSE